MDTRQAHKSERFFGGYGQVQYSIRNGLDTCPNHPTKTYDKANNGLCKTSDTMEKEYGSRSQKIGIELVELADEKIKGLQQQYDVLKRCGL